MNFDWTFLARDLAAHLVAANDMVVTERMLRDAQRDAALLVAPPEFWTRVASEYEKQASHLGLDPKDKVRATLRRFRDGL
jgi:hypothetical protein